MARKRSVYRYELKARRKVVYRGITKNPKRRETQHRNEGKRFTRLRTVGPPVTKKTAERWESRALKTYRQSHKGKNPRYNKTSK